jgi:cysteine-rich repeat protein
MRVPALCVLVALCACGDNIESNKLPTISDIEVSTPEDTPFSRPLDAVDPEGQPLTITAMGAMHGTAAIDGTSLTYTPAGNYNGSDTFTIDVSDGTNVAHANVTIHVTPVNDAPTGGADTVMTDENVPLATPVATLLANDSDVDGDTLTITSVGNAQHGAVDIVGTDIRFVPAPGFSGIASYEYMLSDGNLVAVVQVTVNIGAVDQPPVANDDMATTAEDTALQIPAATLLANDTDPESQTLTVTAVSNATNGTVALAGTTVTFTPAADFNGTAGFDYTISDGTNTDTAHVTVTVTAVNDAPVAVDDAATTPEDTQATIPVATLLANDTDVDGPTLTVSAVGNPTNGTVMMMGANVIFTPAANFTGTATFEYTVTDGTLSDTGLVTVTVTAVDDAPVAVDDTATTAEDTAVMIPASTLLANDTDSDGPTLTITAVGNAVNGAVALSATTITFTPAANFHGAARFDYTVSDGTLSDTGTVVVTVTAVNDAPVAGNDSATTSANTPASIAAATLLANDTDVDGDTLTITAVANATNGTVSLVGSTVTFTPTTGFSGTGTFEYTVSDGALTDTGLVTVTVNGVCGDGVVSTGETCDDGGTTGGNGCSATCQVESGWTCSGAPSICTPICGDTLVLGGEQCDDGNTTNGDGCTSTCLTERCGDGVVNNSNTEQCDDGNIDETDGCTSQCLTSVACNVTAFPGGDRFAVDPASGHCYVSFDDDQTSYASAESSCEGVGGYLATIASSGEEGFVDTVLNPSQNPWIGATDDANTTDDVFVWETGEPFSYKHFAAGQPDNDASFGGFGDCLHIVNSAGEWNDTNCTLATFVTGRICEIEPLACGDGVLQTVNGETCDDGNNVSNDGCSATCKAEVCGDGIVQTGEACDDGNTAPNDGCSATCQIEGCGDGIVQTGEACDDGNTNSFDGCSATCTVEQGATCSGTAPTTCSRLVINELNYDNVSTDNTNGNFEYVEIFNAGTAPANLTGVAFVLMNGGGTTPAEYFFDGSTGAANVAKRILLTSAGVPGNALPPGGYIVIGPAGLTALVPPGVFTITIVPGASGWIQNGSPDAVGLFDVISSTMIDSLAYEGPVSGNIIGVTGPVTFTEGTSSVTAPADPQLTAQPEQSLVRSGPNGKDTNDNTADFTLAAPSPGLPN